MDSPSSTEPFCGSPTVISSSKPSQDERGEGSKELSQCTYPALDNPVQISETGQRSKPESPTSKDDKSFSFEVGLVPDAAAKDNNTGNELKPFPCIQSSGTTVVQQLSLYLSFSLSLARARSFAHTHPPNVAWNYFLFELLFYCISVGL